MASAVSVDENAEISESARIFFKNDPQRGKWTSIWDFYLTSIGHSFGYVNITVIPFLWSAYGGVFAMIFCLINLLLSIIPVFFLQSTIGQFSSSGYLTIFRISPLFKGVGYLILVLNLTTITFYSISAAYPLAYLIRSMASTLPWMDCSHEWNTVHCTEVGNETFMALHVYDEHHNTAPMEFFRREILKNSNDISTGIAWPIVGCLFLVWTLVSVSVMNGVSSVGKIVKYSTLVALVLLTPLYFRFAFLRNASTGIGQFFTPPKQPRLYIQALVMSPMISTFLFGSGWGNVITLASYNDFNTNVVKYSFAIPIILFLMTILSAFLMQGVVGYLNSTLNVYPLFWETHEMEASYVVLAYVFGTLEASQFWAVIFYMSIFLLQLNAIVVQMFGICTALFDEYLPLRLYKKYISLGLGSLLFLISIGYATKNGYMFLKVLSDYASLYQMIICFVELIMIFWIYGRTRFQRDIKFMLGREFPSWIFFIIRVITPIVVLLAIFVIAALCISYYYTTRLPVWAFITFALMKYGQWVIIPGYAIYKLWDTIGTIPKRIQKCIRPKDWYPADSDRQGYENVCSETNTTYELLND